MSRALRHRLREAGGDELTALLAEGAAPLSAEDARSFPAAAPAQADLSAVARDLRLRPAVRRKAALSAGVEGGGG